MNIEKKLRAAARRKAAEDNRRAGRELRELRKALGGKRLYIPRGRGPARGARPMRSRAGEWVSRGKQPAVIFKQFKGGRAGDRYAAREGILLDTNMGGLTPADREAVWDMEQAKRPRLASLIQHYALSRPEGHPLTREQCLALVREHLKEIGAHDCAFVAYLHTNTPRQHIHVIVSRARPDGALVDVSWQRLKWRDALRRAEARLGLQEVDRPRYSPREIATERARAAQRRSERRGTPVAWIDPGVVRDAIARSRSPTESRSSGRPWQLTVRPS